MSKIFIPIEPARIEWRNGEPYSLDYEDVYFSRAGGLSEASHVFIEGNALPDRFRSANHSFVIGELGFGSGLNFLLACQVFLQVAPANATLHFMTCEKHPLLPEDLKQCLERWPMMKKWSDALLQVYPDTLTPGFHYLALFNGRIQLTLMLGDAAESLASLIYCGDAVLESKLRSWCVDAWFLDGFSPKKNQAMWSEQIFQSMAFLSHQDTTCATFSVAGDVRRGLMNAGFLVVKKKGYGEKREMSTAVFDKINQSWKTRHTPWSINVNLRDETTPSGNCAAFSKDFCLFLPHSKDDRRSAKKEAIVIGAGLAGSFIAYELAQRNWKVTVLEKNSDRALGASGVEKMVLFPNLSIYDAPLTRLMLRAFLYAADLYRTWLNLELCQGELKGILHLLEDEKMQKRAHTLLDWFRHYPRLGEYVDNAVASHLAGIQLAYDALWIPKAGWMNAQSICQFLGNHASIQYLFNQSIDNISYQEGLWHAGEHRAPTLIIASGFLSNQFNQTSKMPLTFYQGQMTQIDTPPAFAHLKVPICGKGHMLPPDASGLWLGASYHPNCQDLHPRQEDDITNTRFVKSYQVDNLQVKRHFLGVRGATTDYRPLVGGVPILSEFITQYQGLSTNSKRFIPAPGAYYPGLYLMTGFGSRGLTCIPWCARFLASQITQEPFGVERAVIESISPARFCIQDIIRKA